MHNTSKFLKDIDISLRQQRLNKYLISLVYYHAFMFDCHVPIPYIVSKECDDLSIPANFVDDALDRCVKAMAEGKLSIIKEGDSYAVTHRLSNGILRFDFDEAHLSSYKTWN